jgi:hypothetical protein
MVQKMKLQYHLRALKEQSLPLLLDGATVPSKVVTTARQAMSRVNRQFIEISTLLESSSQQA